MCLAVGNDRHVSDIAMSRTAAADLVAILYDEGISHLFVNLGMFTAPLRQALAEAQEAGMPHPQPVLCGHEQVAVAAAHGHHLASSCPEAAMVHVDAGELNLDGALENAQDDRIPVTVFSASRTPPLGALARGETPPQYDEPRLTGKWAADLGRGGNLATLVRRAFQISRAEPSGLTHVLLPPDALRMPAGKPSRRLAAPRPPAPDPSAMEDMAELLATAESPLIVAGRIGRHSGSVQWLSRLAETLGAPVIDFRYHVNLPPRHPLNAAIEGREFVLDADAILFLDVDVPCLARLGRLPPQAWLLQIDIDCLKTNSPSWACPIEIAITADTALALQQLQVMLAERLSPRRRHVEERRWRVEAAIGEARENWREWAVSADPKRRADATLAELDRALPEDALVLEESPSCTGAVLRQMERQPGHFFRRSGSTFGWSLGAAIGTRLARPHQPVVAICDDTTFEQSLPRAVFWSAHRVGAPFLTIVMNRRGGAPASPGRREGRAGPTSDIVDLAKACDAVGEVVHHPSEIASAIERLLATTRDGVCTVVDVRLPRS